MVDLCCYGGVIVYVAAQLIKTIMDGQMAFQQKKINRYIISEYMIKYGNVKDMKEDINKTKSNING